jgi:hypothetical protein
MAKKVGKMKYRVKEICHRYYPQYKCFLFWDNFFAPWFEIHKRRPPFTNKIDTEVYFDTEKEAQDYINKKIKNNDT